MGGNALTNAPLTDLRIPPNAPVDRTVGKKSAAPVMHRVGVQIFKATFEVLSASRGACVSFVRRG